MIGKIIGRYEIVEKIGEGGMGSVWRAEDPLLSRTIALKFLPEPLSASSEARQRFLREARAASELDHPGIATVFDAGESDGRVYIALKYVDGETVSDRVSSGPVSVAEACRVTMAACEALGHAHAHGILHRDVTSRNVMIARDGRVVIVDFGLALPEEASRLTRTGTALGTAAYMAPEVISGKPADRRSDIYGLGVLLYEMLTGRLPHRAERAEALQYLVVHSDPQEPKSLRSELSAGLNAVALKALARDPRERYQTAEEFSADLRQVVGGAGLPVVEKWVKGRATRKHRLRRNLTLGIGVALGLAGIMIFLWSSHRFPFASRQTLASVAVLPFTSASADPAGEAWIVEGIGQSLVVKLTKVSNLRVIPWPTSRGISLESKAIKEVARDLKVDGLIVGSIRQSGDRIQSSVSLVDAKSESQYWAEEFEEPISQIFDLEREIAHAAAVSIKGRLSGSEEQEISRPSAHDADAYKLYLDGSLALQAVDQMSGNRALDYFERAVELDPGLSQAYVGIGAVHSDRFFYGWEGGSRSLKVAEASYLHALELDPDSRSARRGLVRVFWEQGRSEDCLKQGATASRDTTHIDDLQLRAEAYVLGGLPDKAVLLLQREIELDPANRAAHFFLVLAHAWASQYEQVIEAGETFIKRFGEDPWAHSYMGMAYFRVGDQDAAEVHFKRAKELGGGSEFLGEFYFVTGNEEEAHRYFLEDLRIVKGKLDAYPDNFRMRAELAIAYGQLGERDLLREVEKELLKPENTPEEFPAVALAHVYTGEFDRACELLGVLAKRGTNSWALIRSAVSLEAFERLQAEPGYADCDLELKKLYDRLAQAY